VKGRFAKVQADSSPKEWPSSGWESSKAELIKGAARIQTVMSAVDLTSLQHAVLAKEMQQPKIVRARVVVRLGFPRLIYMQTMHN
jgi:hypothetical protein